MRGGFDIIESVVHKEAEATRQVVTQVRLSSSLAMLSALLTTALDGHCHARCVDHCPDIPQTIR